MTQFPPLVDFNQPDGGLAWAELQAFANRHDVSLKPVVLPSARLFNRVVQGDWQATVVTLSDEFEGVQAMSYKDQVVVYGLVAPLTFAFDIEGIVVATLRTGGANLNAFQQKLLDQGAIIHEVNSLEQAYLMAQSKRVDVVLGVEYQGKFLGAPDSIDFYMAYPMATLPFNLYINTNDEQAKRVYQRFSESSE